MTANQPKNNQTPLPSDLVLIRSELKELRDEILKSRKQVFKQAVFGTVTGFALIFLILNVLNKFLFVAKPASDIDKLTEQLNEQNRKLHDSICTITPEIEQCR